MSKKRLISYLRLKRFDRPIGIYLLLFPTLWGLWLARQGIPSTKLLVIFILGAIATRALGCVINDIADRKFDPLVERTKNRPLAAKNVSLLEAFGLVFALAILALYLVLQTNRLTLYFAIAGVFLMFFYPFTKRFLPFPQAILGFAFGAWPVLMGFSAVQNRLPLIAYVLAAAAYCWTVAYDTVYALADKKDDLKIGIHSTAILFGRYVMHFIVLFQVIMLALLVTVGILASLNVWFYVSLCIATFLFIYQYNLMKLENPARCMQAFRFNQWIGWIIVIGFFVAYK